MGLNKEETQQLIFKNILTKTITESLHPFLPLYAKRIIAFLRSKNLIDEEAFSQIEISELTKFFIDYGRIEELSLDNLGLNEYLYDPGEKLIAKIGDYKKLKGTLETEDAGKLMEQIATLAFTSLKGWSNVKNYRSYDAQHDLVIWGDSEDWYFLMIHLRLPLSGRVILVEAKNQKSSISNDQFLRLCSLIQNKFENTCHLGLFLSSTNISGLKKKASQKNQRGITLKDAHATQILFHARTKKYIIVLDENDILNLTKKGSLPRILQEKIVEIEAASLLQIEANQEGEIIDLPPYLIELFSS